MSRTSCYLESHKSMPAQALTQICEHPSRSKRGEVRDGFELCEHLSPSKAERGPGWCTCDIWGCESELGIPGKQGGGRRAGGERAQLANCRTSTSIHFYSASTLLLLLLLLHSYSALFSVQLNCWCGVQACHCHWWFLGALVLVLGALVLVTGTWCTGAWYISAWYTGACYWCLVHWCLVHWYLVHWCLPAIECRPQVVTQCFCCSPLQHSNTTS